MTQEVERPSSPSSDPGACVHELIAKQAARTPDQIAVVAGDRELSYRELDRRAERVAGRLAALGAGPDLPVAMVLGRSVDMIVALLGILKSGAAYLPLDVELPPERLALILGGARPRVILTETALADRLPESGSVLLCIDDPEPAEPPVPDLRRRQADPHSLAYIIYTSGSTGVPKGIMIEHHALRDRSLAKAELFGFGPADRMLQFTALSFDAAAAEIFPTLLSGATLVVHTDPRRTSPPELIGECARLGITAVMLPPVMLQLLTDLLESSGASLPWLRLFLTGGESIPADRLAAWARLNPHRPRFLYAYGPTETTITATLYESSMDPEQILGLDKVPIGRPLPGTGIHLLDERLRPVATGEVYISGVGLARGYVDDPAMTADRFRPDPFADRPGARMYRSGDLARWTAGGELEFLGRIDDQVKVRGFRVDLGDVEAALAANPALGGVAVLFHDDRLTAYCVPRTGAAPTAEEIRAHLRTKLPEYMIPSVVVLLDALPQTPGGKIDRRALPTMVGRSPDQAVGPGDRGSESDVPSSPIEETLSEIWSELLHRDRVGVREDFFAAGGDSLLANRMVARIRDALGIEVPLREVFTAPTIQDLAAVLVSLAVRAGDDAALLDLLAELEQSDADRGRQASTEPA